MAEYIYSRYAVNEHNEEVLIRSGVNLGSFFDVNGYLNYTMSGGLYRGSGDAEAPPTVGSVHVLQAASNNAVTTAPTGRFRKRVARASLNTTADEYRLDTTYSRGAYVDDIIAEEGQYPEDGPQGDYWYVRGKKYSRFPSVKVGGEWKAPTDGFVKVEGVWRPITETLIRVDGEWKTLV